MRVPSWCDRIMHRSKPQLSITDIEYDSVPEVFTSDHKPVYGVFALSAQLPFAPREVWPSPTYIRLSGLRLQTRGGRETYRLRRGGSTIRVLPSYASANGATPGSADVLRLRPSSAPSKEDDRTKEDDRAGSVDELGVMGTPAVGNGRAPVFSDQVTAAAELPTAADAATDGAASPSSRSQEDAGANAGAPAAGYVGAASLAAPLPEEAMLGSLSDMEMSAEEEEEEEEEEEAAICCKGDENVENDEFVNVESVVLAPAVYEGAFLRTQSLFFSCADGGEGTIQGVLSLEPAVAAQPEPVQFTLKLDKGVGPFNLLHGSIAVVRDRSELDALESLAPSKPEGSGDSGGAGEEGSGGEVQAHQVPVIVVAQPSVFVDDKAKGQDAQNTPGGDQYAASSESVSDSIDDEFESEI